MESTTFPEFVDRLRERTTAEEAIELSDRVRDEVPGWAAENCREWARCLQQRQLAQEASRLGLDDLDVGLPLFEAVLARMDALRQPSPVDAASTLIVEAATVPLTVDIPRRYLIPLYKEWVRVGFVPGVAEYLTRTAERATAGERVEIARLVEGAEETQIGADYLVHWAVEALPKALTLAPERLPAWLKLIEADDNYQADPVVAAMLRRCRDLLARIPAGSELPDTVRDYLQSQTLDPGLTSLAKQDIDACKHDHLRMPKLLLDGVIWRDLALLEGGLPVHVKAAACNEARNVLSDYHRLRLAGGAASALSACALLTMAIELQLRWALTQGCEPADRDRIRKSGLAALAEFLSRPIEELRPLELVARPASEVRQAMITAGQIRNAVHHKPSTVCERNKDDLHRMIFDTDPRAPRLLARIATLRVRRGGKS